MRAGTAEPARTRLRGQDGAAAGEYLAMLVLVAAVASILGPANLAAPMTDMIRAAFCQLTDGPCASASTPTALTDADFQPELCNLAQSSSSAEVGVSIAIFDASEGLEFGRVDRSDGTTAFTLINSGGLGVSAEIGAEADLGVASVGATAEARAGLAAQAGDTWIVPTSEADDLQNRLMKGESLNQTVGRFPLIGNAIASWGGDLLFGELDAPDITFVAAGVELSAEAKVSVDVMGQPLAGAGAGIEGAILLGVEYDESDSDPANWTTSQYIQADVSGSAELGYIAGKVGTEQGVTSVIKMTRDSQGNLVEMEFVSSISSSNLGAIGTNLPETTLLLGGSTNESVVETLTIPLRSDSDREIAETWMTSLGTVGVDEMSELATRQAIGTYASYDGTESGLSLGAKVALGLKLGAEGSVSTSQSNLNDIYYLGAPQASGQRDLIPFTDCLAGAGG